MRFYSAVFYLFLASFILMTACDFRHKEALAFRKSSGAYMLLVSYQAGTAETFRTDMAETVRGSPYDGIAVPYRNPYVHDPFSHAEIEKKYEEIARISGKDIWPWVFINGIIGYDEKVTKPEHRRHLERKEYFKKIKGMDIYNKSGELAKFLDIWRGSFRAAKKVGAPGIFVDLEAYNNYTAYKIDYLSRVLGQEQEVVSARLKSLGSEMADIAAKEYPDATIWFFFTGLDHKKWNRYGFDYRSVTYIVIGMLQRSLKAGYSITFIDGGSGPCIKDLVYLKSEINKHKAAFKEHLVTYPNLRLGKEVAPWIDASNRIKWMKNKKICEESTIKNAEEWIPIFQELIDNYDYIWVYAAGVGDYRPFKKKSADRMNAALKAARVEANKK